MSALESILTALGSLAQNKVRAFLTTLGVVIGVMSVIVLVSLGEGAQAYIKREFAGMGSNILIVNPGKQETTGMIPVVGGAFHKLTYENAREIQRKATGIAQMSANVVGAGYVQFGERRRDVLIIGCTEGLAEVRQLTIQLGRFITTPDVDKNNRVCVIGQKVKDELFGSQPALHQKITINRSKHLIIGVLEKKGMMLGINLDDIVIIPLPSAQQMFQGGEDFLLEILVTARSAEDIKPTADSIRQVLTAAHDYTEDFTITDQDGMLGAVSKIFDALRFMLAGIACISLLVGGIGIMNIMLVSVRERTREVGIRKAVGATRRDIGFQFLIEAVTLSVFGGILGILLGWVSTTFVRLLYPSLPVSLSAWSVTMAFTFSLSVGVFFGVYPAYKASGVDPVEALRYE